MSSIHPSRPSPAGKELADSRPATSHNSPLETTTSPVNPKEKTTSQENPFEGTTSFDCPSESINNNTEMGGVNSKSADHSGIPVGEHAQGVNGVPWGDITNIDDDGHCGNVRASGRPYFRCHRKAKAIKAEYLRNAVEEDYDDDDWLTESELDDEQPGYGDKSGWPSLRRARAQRRAAAFQARKLAFKAELKERKKMEVLPQEDDRFVDRSFRHGLQNSIKGWKNVEYYTTEETTLDMRLNSFFGGPQRPPKGSRTEYKGPLSNSQPLLPGQPPAATWPEIKELLNTKGISTREFENRGKKDRERVLESLRTREGHRRAKPTGGWLGGFDNSFLGLDSNSDNDGDDDKDSDDGGVEELARPQMTTLSGWDYVNPLNWSIDIAPNWVQDFFIWARQIERIYYDDTDWYQIIVAMISFWLGGIFTLLMVWTMARAMMATGQWRMTEPGHPAPI
ncbi:hypothetical protein TWF718_005860 [Orbilia javanica]|uniref:Uncharacterized protein n=1 Tax=Orbilia javanica TaxID=47235 RepID=A0AAN8RDV4_9PEZI